VIGPTKAYWLVIVVYLVLVYILIHRGWEREKKCLPNLKLELSLGFCVQWCLNSFWYSIWTMHVNNLHV